MNTRNILFALLVIVAISMLAFVGVSAYTEGSAEPVLLLFIGLMTPIVTTVLGLLKGQKTLEVSEATDKKVDQLLNGSLQGKIAALEQDAAEGRAFRATMNERVGTIERNILTVLARLD